MARNCHIPRRSIVAGSPLQPCPPWMRAGVQETIDVHVSNDSEQTWRWGKDARPEIRLADSWSADGEAVPRARLPCERRSRRTSPPEQPSSSPFMSRRPRKPGRDVAASRAAPRRAGHRSRRRHRSSWTFGRASCWRSSESPHRSHALCLVLLEAPVDVEPVVLLGNDSDRAAYGDYPLRVGTSRLAPGRPRELRPTDAETVRLLWRTLGIVMSARRYRRSGDIFDMRVADMSSTTSCRLAALVLAVRTGRTMRRRGANGGAS